MSEKKLLTGDVDPVAWSVTVGDDYRNCIEISHCKEDVIAQYEQSTKGGLKASTAFTSLSPPPHSHQSRPR